MLNQITLLDSKSKKGDDRPSETGQKIKAKIHRVSIINLLNSESSRIISAIKWSSTYNKQSHQSQVYLIRWLS